MAGDSRVNPVAATANAETRTVRSAYSRLLHELQFRATRNALMNYHEAGNLQTKSTIYQTMANIFTVASASGVLATILNKGKLLASRAGLAGVIGFPLSMAAQFMGTNTSELVPNYSERAKKHIKVAASWVSIAETARAERMRIKTDAHRDAGDIIAMYDRLVDRKSQISSQIMISQETHRYFNENPYMVCDAIKRRAENYSVFAEFEKTHLTSISNEDNKDQEEIYF